GKQVLNLKDEAIAVVCRPVAGGHVACVGDNGKLLIFPLAELPEMTRGKGVRLQKIGGKKGGFANLEMFSDAKTFALEDGLTWLDPAGRTRTERELADWIGKRASAGRKAPRGFPKDNKFT
ncbi:MAG: DNA gyrase C-terminal beta-propeller domain-containing protein, partial [Pseudomonadota bacterium]